MTFYVKYSNDKYITFTKTNFETVQSWVERNLKNESMVEIQDSEDNTIWRK